MTVLLWPVVAMTGCGLATFLLAGRLPARVLASLGLLTVLIGCFALFLTLAPLAPQHRGLPVLVFFGTVAVFRLMGQFERPD